MELKKKQIRLRKHQHQKSTRFKNDCVKHYFSGISKAFQEKQNLKALLIPKNFVLNINRFCLNLKPIHQEDMEMMLHIKGV